MTISISRKSLLCSQATPVVTGIDFIQVVDPQLQTEILVFFIVDPDQVVASEGPPQVFMIDLSGGVPLIAAPGLVTISPTAGGEGPAPQPNRVEWDRVALAGATRTVLRLVFAEAGGFANYDLTVNHALIDPFFSSAVFSFKQGCDTGFDCAPDCDCPPEALKDVEIDYLARDFESFNSALHDFTTRHFPRWGEHLTADAGSMAIDLFAALGDEFAYIQDRFAREAFLETATQRRSLQRLARLVDYVPDPGRNATAMLSLLMRPAGPATAAIELNFTDRLTVWATPAGKPPVPFELGAGLADHGSIFVHHHWNRMRLHLADPGTPCLKAGATELHLAPGIANLALPRPAQLPAGATPETFWVGRWMILASEPADPSVTAQAWPIRIVSVEQLEDPIMRTGGNPSRVTRIVWEDAQALPFELRIGEGVLFGNTMMANAGMTVTERFAVGHENTAEPDIALLPRAVEREGILDQNSCDRTAAVIYGLRRSEEDGVAFAGEHDLTRHRTPEIELTEISDTASPPASTRQWFYQDTLLDGDEDDRYFTLDPGMWRDIVRYQRNGETIVHADYAGDAGWSIRFGSGAFGRGPELDSLYDVRYRTFAGARSNLPAGTIRTLDPPDGTPRDPALVAVADVTNLLPASGGSDPESAADIRLKAPEFFRAFPLRAVRDEDYREIIERLDWVQKAGARARWTGSWLTEFVTADPDGGFEMTPEQLAELNDLADAIRQAGRDVIVRQPRFLSIDIDITICVAAGSYGGQVREAVIDALAGKGGSAARTFFDPDNFTFGDPLRRSALEAAVQAVPGVRGVAAIKVRPRHRADWQDFDQPEIAVAMNELIRVENDPRFPERGAITVRETSAACQGGACP